MVDVQFDWNAVPSATQYVYELYISPGNVLFATGQVATNSLIIQNLNYSTEYMFFVYTDCGSGNVSEKEQLVFLTPDEPPIDVPMLFDVDFNLLTVQESGGASATFKPNPTPLVTQQTFEATTNDRYMIPNVGNVAHYNNPLTQKSLYNPEPNDPITASYLYLYIENFYADYPQDVIIYIRVAVQGTVLGDIKIMNLTNLSDPITVDFSEVGLDFGTLINNDNMTLDVVYVDKNYRSLDVTNYLNSLYPNMDYPY